MKRKILIFALIVGLQVSSHASMNGISEHSRANCANNESITWDFTAFHVLGVVGFHTADYQHRGSPQWEQHRVEDRWSDTRRSAAVHWGEGTTPPGYVLVQGWHWENIGGNVILLANTSVDNCSIYTGWWNF